MTHEQNLPHILTIDDDETLLVYVKEVLEQNGYKSSCVDNGPAGVEKAQTEQPDIIILDRRMPEMDGNQVLIALQGDEKTRNIPVVMLTGDNRISDVSTSFDLGATDYIVKPFNTEYLLACLKKTLLQTR